MEVSVAQRTAAEGRAAQLDAQLVAGDERHLEEVPILIIPGGDGAGHRSLVRTDTGLVEAAGEVIGRGEVSRLPARVPVSVRLCLCGDCRSVRGGEAGHNPTEFHAHRARGGLRIRPLDGERSSRASPTDDDRGGVGEIPLHSARTGERAGRDRGGAGGIEDTFEERRRAAGLNVVAGDGERAASYRDGTAVAGQAADSHRSPSNGDRALVRPGRAAALRRDREHLTVARRERASAFEIGGADVERAGAGAAAVDRGDACLPGEDLDGGNKGGVSHGSEGCDDLVLLVGGDRELSHDRLVSRPGGGEDVEVLQHPAAVEIDVHDPASGRGIRQFREVETDQIGRSRDEIGDRVGE